MGSLFDRLCSEQLIHDYPYHMKNNVQYEVIMGSMAYGTTNNDSDIDIYGFCMPPKHILFPYADNIFGFGKTPKKFAQYQKHGIIDNSRKKEYDIVIYNIVKYFNLCIGNNPNMIDSLFVPTNCVLHSTQIGEHLRSNKKLFLSKLVWKTFRGYAFGQLHKMKDKFARSFVQHCLKYDIDLYAPIKYIIEPIKEVPLLANQMTTIANRLEVNGKRSKRLSLIAKYGYDVKFAYHLVRILDECQQILEEGTLDLTRSKEYLKAIRRGEESMESIIKYFDAKLITLEEAHSKSKLRIVPVEHDIKNLLLECIEMHYGKVENASNEKQIRTLLSIAQTNLDRIERML
jgi:predicted nucleotidyltransferase